MFIAPPSEEALRTPLIGRGSGSPSRSPLETAREELDAQGAVGHVVVNDRLEDAVADSSRGGCTTLTQPLESAAPGRRTFP